MIYIGERCFKDCVNLETVEAPGGIFFGRSENFKNCVKLKNIIGFENSIIYNENVLYCRNNFENTALEGIITIPVGWDAIPGHTFKDCSGITGFYIPDACSSLWTYQTEFREDYGLQISSEEGKGWIDSIRFPEVGSYADCGIFRGLKVRGDIVIPDNITDFNPYTFHQFKCDRLIVGLGSGMTEIHDGFSLAGCEIREIILPSTLESVGPGFATELWSDTIARFPSTMTTFGNESGPVDGPKYIVLDALVPPTLAFTDGYNAYFTLAEYIAVPDAVVDTYKTALGWSVYADKIISQTVFNAMRLKINVPLVNGSIGEELELKMQSKLINKFTEPYPTNVRINVSIDSVPGGATANLWYRDGINPDVDVAVLGYIPPELGESVDEFGRPFTKIFEEPGDKFDLPLYLEGDTVGNYTITFTLVSGAETLSSYTTTFYLEEPFAFKINANPDLNEVDGRDYIETNFLIVPGSQAAPINAVIEVELLTELVGFMNCQVQPLNGYIVSSTGFNIENKTITLTDAFPQPFRLNLQGQHIPDSVFPEETIPVGFQTQINYEGTSAGYYTLNVRLINSDTDEVLDTFTQTGTVNGL